MKATVISLSDNLKQLKVELEEQEEEFRSKFGKELKDISIFDSKQLEVQIQYPRFDQIKQEEDLAKQTEGKETYLQELVAIVKGKLKSKSKGIFSDDKHKERNEKLESFFKNFPTTQGEFIKGLENIKHDLSKKLSEQEISSLCQTRIELNQLQIELKNLQEQQFQIQISPK